jgi:hypothetical protein
MKTRSFFTLLLLLLGVVTIVVAQAGVKKARELADYTPRTLKELASVPDKAERDQVIQGDIVPSRVKVTYEGASRAVGQSKKDVIRAWANRFAGNPNFYIAPYKNETLFSEGDQRYWLVVRKEFVAQFEQELKKGVAVELLLIKLGSVRTGDQWEPVLLVEKFLKPQP